jgi:hypothetical protein
MARYLQRIAAAQSSSINQEALSGGARCVRYRTQRAMQHFDFGLNCPARCKKSCSKQRLIPSSETVWRSFFTTVIQERRTRLCQHSWRSCYGLNIEGRGRPPPSRYLVGESNAAASIPRVVSSAVPSNSSTKLHMSIVWGSAGLPPMISLSAFRSSDSGRRSAVMSASVTMRCCGLRQRKTGGKVHFLCRTGVATRLSHRGRLMIEDLCAAERFPGIVVLTSPAGGP